MVRKGYTAEQIINKLREAEVLISQGATTAEASRKIGVTDQTLRLRSGQALLSLAQGIRRDEDRAGQEAEGT